MNLSHIVISCVFTVFLLLSPLSLPLLSLACQIETDEVEENLDFYNNVSSALISHVSRRSILQTDRTWHRNKVGRISGKKESVECFVTYVTSLHYVKKTRIHRYGAVANPALCCWSTGRNKQASARSLALTWNKSYCTFLNRETVTVE